MNRGQQLTENGVEVALFPENTLCANPHTDRIAIDFGGSQANNWFAPCKLVVKKLMTDYHGVIFWTVNPVLTPKGLTHFSMWLMHDNDVSDLKLGQVINQGDPFYQEGGWGAKGAKTYSNHIHCNVALGHTTQGKPNANGAWELVGSVWANLIFFLFGDETITKTGGLEWKVYKAPTSETAIIEESAETHDQETVEIGNEDVTSQVILDEPITNVLPKDESEAPTENATDTAVIEPMQQEPITEPTPIIEPEPITNTTIDEKHHQEPVNVLYLILEWFIRVLKLLLRGKI